VAVPDDSNPDVFAPSPKTPSGEIYAPITRSHTRTMTGAQIKFYADLWCAFHGIQLGYGSFARPVEEIARRTGRPLRTAERLLSSLEETGWIRDLNMSTWHDKPCRRYRLAETPQEAARPRGPANYGGRTRHLWRFPPANYGGWGCLNQRS
jgi:DNA-binding transcriptional ArsR family regulator